MPDLASPTHTHTVQLPGGDRLTLSWAGVTHTGRRREVNQDAVLAAYPLFVVADGMGGHIGGEIASASTIGRLEALVEGGSVTPRGIEKALVKAVKDIVSHPETTDEGTGTTLTGVFLDTTDGAGVGHPEHRGLARLPAARRRARPDHDGSFRRPGARRRRPA